MKAPRYLIFSIIVLHVNNFFANPSEVGQFGAITRFKYGPDERRAAFNMRLAANYLRTLMQPLHYLPLDNNGDEKNVADYAAQFHKSLLHDQNSILTPEGQKSYKKLVTALHNGLQSDFDAIQRAPQSSMKFISPQASFAFCLQGCDSSLFSIPLFPTLESAQLAASMIELYLMALIRDVLFSDYGTGSGTDANGNGGSLTNDASLALQSLGNAYKGPVNAQGLVDASALFRGKGYGELVGPYISQLALLPVKTPIPATLGGKNISPTVLIKIDQQWAIAGQREFSVSMQDFVTLQNGQIPKKYTANDYDPINKRYISTGRDLGSFIHWDVAAESFFYAAFILQAYGFPYSNELPYYNNSMPNEASFITMGMMEVFAMIEAVSLEAIKASWAQKWRAHRVLRPEAFAGHVHNIKVSGQNPYHLHDSLFEPHAGIDVLELVLQRNRLQANFPDNNLSVEQASTYLLPQIYPEGSPAHPSYPSGHAVVAGAAGTILKAFFQNDTLISTMVAPVMPNPANLNQLIPLVNQGENQLTVAGEINKLASNNSYGRNWAGIHWREDAHEGILLGEKVAITYLQDQAMLYHEHGFNGFVLTKYDGTPIRITATEVTVLS